MLEQILDENPNMVTSLSKQEQDDMAQKIVELVELDRQSRSEWTKENEEWHKIAAQVLETKSFPWNNASNVKYPLLTLTAVHFQARTSADLLKGPDIVRTRIIGLNKDEEEKARGRRISHALSYQIQEEIPNWSDETEQGLMILPLVGMYFKKVFFNPALGAPVSQLVFPANLIYNMHAMDFDRARKTHVLYKYPSEIEDLIRLGYYEDYDYTEQNYSGALTQQESFKPELDDEAPRVMLECHCGWDLDGDGYKEPWVITVDAAAQKIVRIAPRFRLSNITYTDETEQVVRSIKGKNHFIQFGCIPSFNSKTYFSGFGTLLGPVNAGVNSVLNQLIDSGTLSNLPSGFISRGLRVRRGEEGFRPGQWKTTMSNSNEDMRKFIFPLPVKDPSPVLFNLLGLLISAGKEIGGLSESILGENPGQNQPHATTVAVMSQGLKMYSGVFKRVHAGLKKELQMLAELNRDYLSKEKYNDILNTPDEEFDPVDDFNFDNISVIPTAEPNTITEQQKLEKAGRLAQLSQSFPMNRQEVLKRILDAEGHDGIEVLMKAPPPSPPPEIQVKMKELELKTQELQFRMQQEQKTQQFEHLKDYAKAKLDLAKAKQLGDEAGVAEAQREMEAQKMALESQKQEASQRNADNDRLMKLAEMQGKDKERDQNYDLQRRSIAASGASQSE